VPVIVIALDPDGPTELVENSANAADTGNPPPSTFNAYFALLAKELLTGIPNGINRIVMCGSLSKCALFN